MIEYLMKERYSQKYGLLWGAMTADWGDVQPNTDNVVDIDSTTTPAIDVYDNAMFIIALNYLAELTKDQLYAAKWKTLSKSVAENTRKHLWDVEKQKYPIFIWINHRSLPDLTNLRSIIMEVPPSLLKQVC